MINFLNKLKRLDSRSWLVGILILVGLFGLTLTMSRPDTKIAKAAEQAPILAEKIRKSFQMRNSYWGLDTEWVIRQQIAPLNMIKDGHLVNALGSAVWVGGLDGSRLMPSAKSFNIIYDDLSRSECATIASYKVKDDSLLGLISIMINNGTNEKTFTWGGENSLPIDLNVAKEVCKTTNKIIYTYE